MKRLQRRCLLASACLHGLLLLSLFVGSAFFNRSTAPEQPAFEMFDMNAILTDQRNISSGGNPNVTKMPAATPPPPVTPPAQQAPPVQAEEPKPPTKQPEPVKEPPKTVEETRPEPIKEAPKPKPPDLDAFDISKAVKKTGKPEKPEKPANEFDITKATKKVIKPAKDAKETSDGEENARSDKEKRMAQARAGAVTDVLKQLHGGLSSVGGSYEIPGPGGPAYASYYIALRKFYENAWIPPNAGRGDEPAVEVEVVIGKDGTILSQRITKKSGRRELDNSVQNALNRVFKAKAPRFPEGSTDEKRTFRINFDLTEKLSVG